MHIAARQLSGHRAIAVLSSVATTLAPVAHSGHGTMARSPNWTLAPASPDAMPDPVDCLQDALARTDATLSEVIRRAGRGLEPELDPAIHDLS